MKFTYLFLLIIQCFILTSVQAQFKVRTKIIDFKGRGMELTTVSMMQRDVLLSTKYTDSLGICFFQSIAPGEYSFKVSQYGVEMEQVALISSDTTIVIEMAKSKQLEAATINTKKPVFKRKADRMVFNVENSLLSYGNNLYNMLALTPGVRVDDHSVKISGKGEAIIYIDDQVVQLAGEDLINYLMNVPSDDVSRIEVISNPPAKYQAEGSAGIINIVLKTVLKKGYNGDANSSVTRNTYWSKSLGAGVNYNKEKRMFKNRLNVNQTAFQQRAELNMKFPSSYNQNSTKAKYNQSGISNSSDLTYKLNKNSRVVLSSQVNTSRPSLTNATNIDYIRNSVSDSLTKSVGDGESNSTSLNTGLNYTYSMDTLGKKLSIDYNNFNYDQSKNRLMNSHTEYLVSPNYLSMIQTASKQTVRSNSLDVDFELPYEKFSIYTGGRLSNNENLNHFDNEHRVNNTIHLTEKDKFLYNEKIQSLYFTVSTIIKKWELSAGLRGENSIIESQSFTYDQVNNYNYLKFFPSLYVLYNLKEEVYLGGSYSRRIDRPNYAELNPFRLYMNANQYSIGNPFLRPSFTDNIEVYYMFKDKFSTSLNYTHNSNLYGQIPIVDLKTNTQVYTNINFLSSDIVSLSTIYSMKKSFLQSDFQWDLSYSNSYSNSQITYSSLKGFSSSFTLSNQIKTPLKGLTMNLFGMYSFPGITSLVTYNSYYTINTGVMYRSKNKKFVYGLSINDVFKSMLPQVQMYSNGVILEGTNYSDNRSIRFSLTYNFGNNKVHVEDREIKNEEEISRTKSEEK